MRYQDWDVLLFPENSNIPFQEFKTACFCTQDPEYAQPQPLDSNSRSSSLDCTIPIQLPIVAGFIPSLPWGLPFRVSIHSWEVPRLAGPLEQTAYQDVINLFEARVFVDGCCVAATLFKPTDNWPQILDTTSHMDKNGLRDSLRFPPFYPEVLSRNWWNAAENMGRIKVIIAEGFGNTQPEPVFERVKNIVCYNFQHAPLVVLEKFGIAWPNPGMWYQPRHISYPAPSFAVRKRSRTIPDAHSQSPRDRISSRRSTIATCPTTVPAALGVDMSMPPPAIPDRNICKAPDWNTPMNLADPFIDATLGQRYRSLGGRSGSDDFSMPDYSDSFTPASSRKISWVSNTNQKTSLLMAPVSHAQYETISNTTTVWKDGQIGTFVPAQDRPCGNVPTDTSNAGTKSLAAAEARAGSHGHRYGRKGSAKGWVKPTNRKKADVSMKERLSEETRESQDKPRETSTDPSVPVHLRKENARLACDNRATASEGKRKRNLIVPGVAIPLKTREVQSSPTRKSSRKVSQGGRSALTVDDLTVEGGAAKAPLQVLENVQ